MNTNKTIQALEAELQSRVTQVKEMNNKLPKSITKLIFRTIILKRLKRFSKHKTVILNFNLKVTRGLRARSIWCNWQGWGLAESWVWHCYGWLDNRVVSIAGCSCVNTGISLSNDVGSALCTGSELKIANRWVVPVGSVFITGDTALVTARGVIVKVVPDFVFMLTVG